jgi:hypothetical protein
MVTSTKYQKISEIELFELVSIDRIETVFFQGQLESSISQGRDDLPLIVSRLYSNITQAGLKKGFNVAR